MISISRLIGFVAPLHDPEVTKLREKVKKARAELDERLDRDGGARDVARAMLRAVEDAKRA